METLDTSKQMYNQAIIGRYSMVNSPINCLATLHQLHNYFTSVLINLVLCCPENRPCMQLVYVTRGLTTWTIRETLLQEWHIQSIYADAGSSIGVLTELGFTKTKTLATGYITRDLTTWTIKEPVLLDRHPLHICRCWIIK